MSEAGHATGTGEQSVQEIQWQGHRLVVAHDPEQGAEQTAGSIHLRRIQQHSVSINDTAPIQGLSTITPGQSEVLAALKIKKPAHDAQMNLL